MTRTRTGNPANEIKGSTKATVGGTCEFSEVSVLWVTFGSILLKSCWTRMEGFEYEDNTGRRKQSEQLLEKKAEKARRRTVGWESGHILGERIRRDSTC